MIHFYIDEMNLNNIEIDVNEIFTDRLSYIRSCSEFSDSDYSDNDVMPVKNRSRNCIFS